MNKKIYIPVIIVILVLISVIATFLLFKDNKKVTIITLDINPSIEISLDKNDNVIDIRALNDDAKKIVDGDYKGKDLDETFDIMINKLKDNGFINDNEVDVIIYAEGKLNSKDVEGHIFNIFNKSDINPYIITVDKITEEDKELAKKYNISPAKASYINSLIVDNNKLSIDELLDKPVMELKEMKETGNYCDEGYILEGDWCIKEKNRVSAKEGKVCPVEYTDIDGTCYKEGKSIDTGNLKCRDGYTLKGEEFVRLVSENPIPNKVTCTKGTRKAKLEMGLTGSKASDADEIVCVDLSSAKAPTQRCLTINHIMIGGECADGPKPTINGGCYTKDNKNQWICPNGAIYHRSQNSVPKYCPETIKYYNPVVKSYKCNNGYELKNNKCVREEKEGPERERKCESGYELKNDRCVNTKDSTNYINGYYCDDKEERVVDKECIIYERIEVKHN